MMKAYPEYKESGVDWMQKIPSSWDKCKLGHLFSIFNGSTPKSDEPSYWDGDIDWVTPSDLSKINSYRINESSKKITDLGLNSCGTSIVPEGSIVLSTRAPIGSLAVAGKELCTNQGCKSLVARERNNVEPKFFYYLLSVSSEQLNLRGRGTTFLELPTDELSSFPVPKLTYPEQLSIVRYLDIETARIDYLIAEKQNFIKLLSEKRQALISHVVTKGLNPNVPMKDSGVEWIGEIPEHWEVKNLKFCFKDSFKNGVFKKSDDFGRGNKLVNVSDIFTPDNLVNVDTLDKVQVSEDEVKKYRVNHGDIFFVRSSLKEEGIAKSVCFLGQEKDIVFECHIVKGSPDIKNCDPKYLIRLLNSKGLRFEHLKRSTTATMTTISQKGISETPVPQPPLSEQKYIGEYLEKQWLKIQELENETKKSIGLLKEHRTALISAAVTGKIDVREEV